MNESELEFKSFAFEMKASDLKADGTCTFTGRAAAFHNVDHHYDVIDDGAFDGTIDFFLAKGFIGGVDHDWGNPIGAPTSLAKDSGGLILGAETVPTTKGKDDSILITRKVGDRSVVQSLSVGFRALSYEWVDEASRMTAYWASKGYAPTPDDMNRMAKGIGWGMLRIITQAKLYEVSPVTFPANDLCRIDSATTKALKSGRQARTDQGAARAEHARFLAHLSQSQGVEF